jgi:hypothetical protein
VEAPRRGAGLIRPAALEDVAAILALWGAERSAHAVTEDTPDAVLRALGVPRITALVAFDDEDARAFWRSAGYAADSEMGRMVRSL